MTRQEQLQTELNNLIEEHDNFIKRLSDGCEKIETARKEGKNVDYWEDRWIDLLHQYSATCEKIRDIKRSPNFTPDNAKAS